MLTCKFFTDYDFGKAFEKEHNKFIKRTDVQEHFNNYSERSFVNLCNEFWEKPNWFEKYFKEKYSIPSTLKYTDIIRAFPTETYKRFLSDCWCPEKSLEDVLDNYNIHRSLLCYLVYPIEVYLEDYYCEHCVCCDNSFSLYRNISDYKNFKYTIICRNCNCIVNNLLFHSEANGLIEIKGEQYGEIRSDIECITQNELRMIKCPECSHELSVGILLEKIGYNIYCTSCKKNYGTIEELNHYTDKINFYKHFHVFQDDEMIEKYLYHLYYR